MNHSRVTVSTSISVTPFSPKTWGHAQVAIVCAFRNAFQSDDCNMVGFRAVVSTILSDLRACKPTSSDMNLSKNYKFLIMSTKIPGSTTTSFMIPLKFKCGLLSIISVGVSVSSTTHGVRNYVESLDKGFQVLQEPPIQSKVSGMFRKSVGCRTEAQAASIVSSLTGVATIPIKKEKTKKAPKAVASAPKEEDVWGV